MSEAARPNLGVAMGVHAVVAAIAMAGLHSVGITWEVMVAEGWWITAAAVNVGIVLGNVAMFALLSQPDASEELAAEGRRQDLLDSRRIVVEQLRNLESERDKLDPDAYVREREQLVVVGASAARELDEGVATTSAATPTGEAVGLLDELRALRDRDPDGFSAALAELGIAAQPAGGISGEWRGAGYALAIVALVAVLFNAAGDGSRDRRPGETMTGGDQVTSSNEPAAAPPADPRVAQARRRMETLQQQSSADPSNLDLLNQLTEAAMSAEDLAVAMEANTAALKIAPEDPESRVYKAVLQAFVGKRVEANATLDAVIASSPDHPKAYVYKGLLMMRTDPAGAIPLFEKALAIEDTPELRQALAQARMRAAGAPGGSATPPPAAGGADLIASGTITMGAEGASGTTLFVYVRQPGGAAGPPLGALKLPPSPFPQQFTLTKANLLPMFARMPLPEAVDLGFRLDADGDAATKTDGEPSASLPKVKVGTTGLTVELQ